MLINHKEHSIIIIIISRKHHDHKHYDYNIVKVDKEMGNERVTQKDERKKKIKKINKRNIFIHLIKFLPFITSFICNLRAHKVCKKIKNKKIILRGH